MKRSLPTALLACMLATTFNSMAQEPFQRAYVEDEPAGHHGSLLRMPNGDFCLNRMLFSNTQTPAIRFVVERMDANGGVLQINGYTHPSDFGLFITKSEATSDGGSISAGGIFDGPTFSDSVCVLRMDQAAGLMWSKAIAFEGTEHEVKGVAELADGGFIIYGLFQDPATFKDKVFLFKLSATGMHVWSRVIGSSLSVENYSVGGLVEAANSELWLCGHGDFSSLWLIKLNSAGITQQRNALDIPDVYSQLGKPHGLFLRPDGDMDFFYCPLPLGAGTVAELVVIRANASGNVTQYKAIDIEGAGYGYTAGIDQHGNGDYMVAVSVGTNTDGFIIAMDADANVDWLQRIDQPDHFNEIWDVIHSAEGGAYLYADIAVPKSPWSGWLMRTDGENATCNSSWVDYTESSGTGSTSAFTINESEGPSSANTSFTMIETSAPRVPLCTNISIAETAQASFTLFPNPSTGTFTIERDPNSDLDRVRVSDMLGRAVHEQSIRNATTIDLRTSLPAGVYSVAILDRKYQVLGTERLQLAGQ